jgi:ADP-ribosylglycohydrolase
MSGAICGDVIGRPYEFDNPVRSKDFELFSPGLRFSDDTVLYLAIAKAAMDGLTYWDMLVEFGKEFADVGFAKGFTAWVADPQRTRGQSWANGSAMRSGSLAWIARDMQEALEMARESAMPTHSHERGILGAQAVVCAIRVGLEGGTAEDIRNEVSGLTGYDLVRSVDEIRADYPRFQVSCDRSVPEAIICALEATSYEDAIRNAISLGNDADTQACIAGGIAETLFPVPDAIRDRCLATLPPRLLVIERRLALIRSAKTPHLYGV